MYVHMYVCIIVLLSVLEKISLRVEASSNVGSDCLKVTDTVVCSIKTKIIIVIGVARDRPSSLVVHAQELKPCFTVLGCVHACPTNTQVTPSELHICGQSKESFSLAKNTTEQVEVDVKAR